VGKGLNEFCKTNNICLSEDEIKKISVYGLGRSSATDEVLKNIYNIKNPEQLSGSDYTDKVKTLNSDLDIIMYNSNN
jgi:hypothetical protein